MQKSICHSFIDEMKLNTTMKPYQTDYFRASKATVQYLTEHKPHYQMQTEFYGFIDGKVTCWKNGYIFNLLKNCGEILRQLIPSK